LYDLVVAGHTVSVTDSKSGTDITNLVLAQALIEHSPEKFASFPPEVFHLMIRASEHMLKGLAADWFLQLMKGMSPSAPASGTTAGDHGSGWMPGGGFGWPTGFAPTAAPKQEAADPVADLKARMDAMMREVADLQGRGNSTR
jgi:polyhydroxyalkanoate synthesis regulator protein